MSKELKITADRIKRLVRGLDNCRDAQQARTRTKLLS